MPEKRIVIAVALCMGILILWTKLFPPTPPSAPTTETGAAGVAGAAAAPIPPDPAAGAATGASGAPAAAGEVADGAGGGEPAAPTARVRGPEESVELDTPEARYVFSSYGGALRSARLKSGRFLRRDRDPASGEELVRTDAEATRPLSISFPKADFAWPADLAWRVERAVDGAVTFTAETAEVAVVKRIRALGGYRLALDVSVRNLGPRPQGHALALHLFGRQDPDKHGGGFFTYALADLTEMACLVNDSVERHGVEALAKNPQEFVGTVRWIAADQKFMTIAAAPAPETPPQDRKCGQRHVDATAAETFLLFATRTVAPAQETSYGFEAFVGPKVSELLEAVKPGGVDAELPRVINVTFAALSRPMLSLLKLFHKWAGNWGLAIILLTVFVRLVTFYPTHKTMMSGKKMQKLAPKLQALRKKYENDRQRMGVETMNLYKAHGVSPFGGCLPTLIQMPIWIALYSTLNYSVELYRSDFALHIQDLSARDPYFVTPLLMGAVMFLQMRMTPQAGADPQQHKIMTVMMPIMMTVFCLFLPAGLALYTLTSSALAIAHQQLVNHLDRRASAA